MSGALGLGGSVRRFCPGEPGARNLGQTLREAQLQEVKAVPGQQVMGNYSWLMVINSGQLVVNKCSISYIQWSTKAG